MNWMTNLGLGGYVAKQTPRDRRVVSLEVRQIALEKRLNRSTQVNSFLMAPHLPLLLLDAITAYFIESGPVFDKTSDDLRHELAFQNDWHYEEFPDIATEEVTLLQLLQASTVWLATNRQEPLLQDFAFIGAVSVDRSL